MMIYLEKRWNVLWEKMDITASPAMFKAILAAFSEPQRHYHTLQHLGECFAHFDELQHLAEHPVEVELALWFHDSVYDVHARDNETQSAAWADRALLAAGLPEDACARIHTLIMATCHDAPPASNDARLLTDIDLAILGAEPDRFAEYERQIRLEYAHVPDALFKAKRREILQGFLDRERLFQTPACHARYETAARRNLASAIGTTAL